MIRNELTHIVNAGWRSMALVAVLIAQSFLVASGQSTPPKSLTDRNVFQESEVVLETPTGKLYGTLTLPAGKAPFPVVLIIAGSGRTDRDGNSVGTGKSDTLRLLAEGFAQFGIASSRYDKRSVGKSASARTEHNTFEIQVDDAASWVAWLGKDARFRSVGIVGHSEGALIGAITAQRGGVRALISLSGGGSRFYEGLTGQMERAVRDGHLSPKAFESMRGVLAELCQGRTVTTRPPNIPDELWVGMFQPRAQEYIISICRYDPVVEIAKLPPRGIKLLVVYGTNDLQVTEEETLKVAAAAGVQAVLIAGMNHELKTAPPGRTANDAASEDPRRPLAGGLSDQLIPFLKGIL